MKKEMINKTHIEGLVYDHKLAKKVSGPNSKNPGTEFISGELQVATDYIMDETGALSGKGMNVVPIHFTYVTAVTGKGNNNATYQALSKIIDEEQTVVKVGKENAFKVRCDSAVDLNEWFSKLTDEKPNSIMRNEGGFVHIVNTISDAEKDHHTFETDMVITAVKDVEGDPDKHTEDYVIVKGAIFNFRKALLPVEFVARSKGAIRYFQGLDVSSKHPVFTKIWGRQLSQTIKTQTVVENAFDEDEVRETTRTTREFCITGANKVPYEWDDEDTITAAEMSQAMSDRELALATIKKRQEEYQASKQASSASAPSASDVDYDF